jgi:hypothetical protein
METSVLPALAERHYRAFRVDDCLQSCNNKVTPTLVALFVVKEGFAALVAALE